MMKNPYVFIVGCPRSGTTLFRHIVDAHPKITISPEAQWIPKWFERRKGLTPDGMVMPKVVPLLLEHSKFALLDIGRGELETLVGNGQPVSYASFVTGIFDLYGKARGKSLVGNKTPDYARRMHILHALWPDARFIHLIRDGRDVALSLMAWSRVSQKTPGTFPTWKDDPVSTAALWWELNVRRGREAGRALGPELYREICYESLVTRPAEVCRVVCSFLGLPFDDAMLRFHESRTSLRPITAGLRDWRTQMPAEDVERFEAAAGALLDELNYPRAIPHLRPVAVEHSTQVRNLLAKVPRAIRPYGLA